MRRGPKVEVIVHQQDERIRSREIIRWDDWRCEVPRPQEARRQRRNGHNAIDATMHGHAQLPSDRNDPAGTRPRYTPWYTRPVNAAPEIRKPPHFAS